MTHTTIVDDTDLKLYASRRESHQVIPEVVSKLVFESAPGFSYCRIPYGDSIGQHGLDGKVETQQGFSSFVPAGRSIWEMGSDQHPRRKATEDFAKRTTGPNPVSAQERAITTFVFVTPRSWDPPSQDEWLASCAGHGWMGIQIIDNVRLADWLREFPAIARFLYARMASTRSLDGFRTPREHWDNLRNPIVAGDRALPPEVFLLGREEACLQLDLVTRREINQVVFDAEEPEVAEDFVAAYLADRHAKALPSFADRCLFIWKPECWDSLSHSQRAHVLVANNSLELDESDGHQMHTGALNRGQVVIFQSGGGRPRSIRLPTPQEGPLGGILRQAGFEEGRVIELASAGSISLQRLKRNLRGLGNSPSYATWVTATELARAMLAGRWRGDSPADQKALEVLTGKPYPEWTDIIRPVTLLPETPLIQRDERWRFVFRAEAWSTLAPHLSDSDLDNFAKAAVEVLGEEDPKFDLPPEEHYMAAIKEKLPRHSRALRKGIAETLALLGARHEVMTCTTGRAEGTARSVVHKLLKGAGWRLWASLGSELPILAEAAPDEFLGALSSALGRAEETFSPIFAMERSGVSGWNYMSGILWALEDLAWDPRCHARAVVALGELATLDPGGGWANRPINSLANIFLPWLPQTCAPLPTRLAAIRALIRDEPPVAWKLLTALLPTLRGASNGTFRPIWRRIIPADWTPQAANDYGEQIQAYAALAIEMATSDISRLEELIGRLAELPDIIRAHVLEELSSEAIRSLPEGRRFPLWNALCDLVIKHRKFATMRWALDAASVAVIEQTAKALAPQSPRYRYRRLFPKHDAVLFTENKNFHEQIESLRQTRRAAIRDMLAQGLFGDIEEIAAAAPAPWDVGEALGLEGNTEIDAAMLPAHLVRSEVGISPFAFGYVSHRFFNGGQWKWADNVVDRLKNPVDLAEFAALLPFGPNTWSRVAAWLGDREGDYWRSAKVGPAERSDDYLEAAQKFLSYGRSAAALSCLWQVVHAQHPFPHSLAESVLAEILASSDQAKIVDQHALTEVIRWLQNNPDVDPEVLVSIEWAYLSLLDHELSVGPWGIERRMASDPAYFCAKIRLLYNSEKEIEPEPEPEGNATSEESEKAQRTLKVVLNWRTVPGTNALGVFDPVAFRTWMMTAHGIASESGHLPATMDAIGRVLGYAPADPDGLWIHRAIADALDARDADTLRRAFYAAKFRERGVFVATGGTEELELAASFHQRADELELAGYIRLGATIRQLAQDYERDAAREAKSNPYEQLS